MTEKTRAQKRRELLEKARDIAANAEAAARELTEDERKSITDTFAEVQRLKTEETAAKAARQQIDEIGELLAAEQAEEIQADALKGATRGIPGRKAGSVGAAFTKSAEFGALREQFPNGVSAKSRVQTNPYHVNGGMKALFTVGEDTQDSPSSARLLTQPDRLGIVPFPYVAPKLRDVVTNGTTTSDKIEYVQMTRTGDANHVNAAAGVRESPDTTGTVGVKPQSGFGFRKASADIITVAHWIPVTKQALSDAAQIRTMIDNFLRQGLEEEIERMIVEGNAAAPTKGEEEWNGIFNTTGVQSQAWDGDLHRTVRRAIGKVTRLGGNVSAVLVSPEVDEELDLMVNAQGNYYAGGPYGTGPATLWGRPRIVIPALSGRDSVIVGDLAQCVLWDREQASITVTDSHADFFVRNLVAILAECRAGFGVLNPSLLVDAAAAAPVTP